MGVIVQCRCGNYVTIESERGETQGRCPQCGQVVLMPPGGAPGAMMGGGVVAAPTMVPEKLRAMDKPPCYLTIRADRVNLMATFDTSGVLISFVEGFAKKLKKQFDVQLAAAPRPGAPCAVVNVLTIDEGNRWLRYFFLFAGHTIFEIEGEVISSTGQRTPFRHKNRGVVGLFGGDSLGMLRMGGMQLAKKVAKAVAKAG
jgi:ribosomal protein S27E